MNPACHSYVTTEGRFMATIRKRGERWQVQVRHHGTRSLSRSFMYRKDAEAWAREQERRYDKGLPMGVESAGAVVTVGELLVRYMTEVTSFKRSGAN